MQHEASAPPLDGLRIIEFAGLGPGPFAGMMSAEMGDRSERASWLGIRRKLTTLFLTQPRGYWTTLLQDSDACFPLF